MPRKLEEIEQDLERYWSEQFRPLSDVMPTKPVTVFERYGTHDMRKILDKVRRKAIVDALRINHGVITLTAEYLGVSNKTITKGIEQFNINPEKIKQDWHERKSKEPKPYRKHITRKDRREG